VTSDLEQSLVFGLALDGSGSELEPEAVLERRPIWCHFDGSQSGSTAALAAMGLESRVVERLMADETRPMMTVLDSGLLLTLRGINLNADRDPVDMVSLRLWMDNNVIVTVRLQILASVQQVRRDLLSESSASRPQRVLTKILVALADRVSAYLETLTIATDALEETLLEAVQSPDLAEVAELRRRIASVRRFVSPQRDALHELARRKLPWLSADEIDRVSIEADRFARYVEDLDLVRERVMVVQEGINQRLQEDQNKRLNALGLLAGLFLPATFLTGVFGMNVGGLPGVESPSGFYWVIGGMLSCSLALYAWLRLRG